MLSTPGRARFEHGVKYDEQLTHAGSEGHLLRLAGRQESLVEVPDDGVEPAGNHCSHVQKCTEPRPTTLDLSPTSQRAAVAVEGSHANQSGDLTTVQRAQLRQLR